jgi:endonuclease G
MGRKSSGRSKVPGAFRRTKAFLVANLVLWGAIGAWFLFQPAPRQREVTGLVRNALEGRKGITAFEVAWDLWQLYASHDYVAGIAPGDKTFVYGGLPRAAGLSDTAVRVLTNTGYMVGYSDALGDPLWAAYHLHDIALGEAPPRPDVFTPDLRTAARIDSQLYNRSDYDRGHMAPNYAIATRYGRSAQEETFQMSNVCPQRHALNAGPWKQLEQRIATNYAGRFGEVWVIAGPVFGANPPRLHRRVAIPEAFYMIVVDESDDRVRAEAFLFPQDTPASAPIDNYLATIDEIEQRTGLDFLSELPDAAESALEARRVERAW